MAISNLIGIFVGDIELSKDRASALNSVPQIGSTIIYKTFRSNGDYGRPFLDYTLRVIDVIYETEEDWNSYYKSTVKVICEQVSVIEINDQPRQLRTGAARQI